MKKQVSLFGTKIIVTVREIMSILIAVASIVWGVFSWYNSDANFKSGVTKEIKGIHEEMVLLAKSDSVKTDKQNILTRTYLKAFDIIGVPFDSIYTSEEWHYYNITRSVQDKPKANKNLGIVIKNKFIFKN